MGGPAATRIYVAGSEDIVLVGASAFVGNVYAPNAKLTAPGYLRAYGSFFVRDFDVAGYAHIAYEEFLGTIVVIQLRVVPAYLLVALAFAVLLLPLLHRAPAVVDVARGQGRWRRIRLLTRVAIYGLVLYALSLGPFFSRSPGLLDGMARALAVVSPAADVYAVYRWHLLDIATVGLGLVSAWAAVFYLRLWWSVARAARGVRRAVWVGSLLLVVGSGAWSLRPPPPPPRNISS